jgi:2-keto-4-pentenoate hydratase
MEHARETPPMTSGAARDGVETGMRALLEFRRKALAAGAEPVGWKIGLNVPALQEHFGLSGPVVGFLTDTTVITAGRPVSIGAWSHPALEVEVAIRVGEDGGIAALAPALELVDLNLGFDDIAPILEGNIFHRGVIFGPELVGPDVSALSVAVRQGGAVLAEGLLREEPEVTVGVVREFLAPHGASLEPGDRLIAGSLIAPLAVAPGDVLQVSFGVLGDLEVRFT